MNHEPLTRAREDLSTPSGNLSETSITELADNELGDAVGGRPSWLVLTVARPVIVESTTPDPRWR